MNVSNETSNTEPNPFVHGLYISLISLVSACGVFLNILLLIVIKKSSRDIRRRTVLITNTTFADLLFVLTFPLDIWYSFNIGNRGALCLSFIIVKLIPLYVALTSLTLLSVERLYIISKMLAPTPTTTYKYQVTCSVVSWVLFSLLLFGQLMAPPYPQQLCVLQNGLIYALLAIFLLELLGICVSYFIGVCLICLIRNAGKNQSSGNDWNISRGFRVRHGTVRSSNTDDGLPTMSSRVASLSNDGGSELHNLEMFTVAPSRKRQSESQDLGTLTENLECEPQSRELSLGINVASAEPLALRQVTVNTRTTKPRRRKLDAIADCIIKRTSMFVLSFFSCYTPTFILVGIFSQVKLNYPYINYVFWFIPLLQYAHVTLYPFIALYEDAYWRSRVIDMVTKWRCRRR